MKLPKPASVFIVLGCLFVIISFIETDQVWIDLYRVLAVMSLVLVYRQITLPVAKK